VYWPEEGGRTASELVWDISSVTMFGIGASVRPLNRLNINADFWFNLGEGGGHLIDYDWLEQGKDWTHRSIHENTDVTKAQIYDINVEVTMFSSGTVTCIGIAGYRHDIFEWEARGGSYIYSDNGFRNSSGTFPPNVHGITYEQSFNAPYLGIGVKGDFDSFQITARVTGSTFAGGKATDQHFRHYLITHDNFSRENTWWALAFGFTYPINKAMAIRASYSYERYDTMKGDTEWHYYDFEERENYTDAAGADLKTSLLFLELSYRF
jgi:plasminogen activator